MQSRTYPVPPEAQVVEDHFGERVADPFRPLEDLDATVTQKWISAQNALTEEILSSVADREGIRAHIRFLWDYPKDGAPFERGGRWFQVRNSGLQPQPVIYCGERPAEILRVLLDPNTFSADGTIATSGLAVSDDGTRLAYATSTAGSDWKTWRVRDTDSGADLPDVVEWAKFGGAAWRRDGSGFYYNTVDRPVEGAEMTASSLRPKVKFHRLGSAQGEDRLVFEAPGQPDWFPAADVSHDGRYLIITVQKGTSPETHVLVGDLNVDETHFVPLTRPFLAKSAVVGNEGPTFYILTNLDAERGRVVKARLGSDEAEWTEVIAPGDETLTEVHVCGDQLVCHFLDDAHSKLRVFGIDGEPAEEIPLPGIVSLEGGFAGHGVIEGRPGSSLLHFKTVSFVSPGEVWFHDLSSRTTGQHSAPAIDFDSSRFVTEQVRALSDDGTPVPMFITRPVRSEPSGDTPVLLYGYGGFDIPLTPRFSVTFATWLDLGGILAVANVRGGGEYGRAWHDAGRLADKQKSFDDFCACARWFTDSGWSRADRVGLFGGSNGGLLVGACLTQHPELFGAAVADVGVFDMLRFHLFTIGWAWKSDYGDPEDPEQYRWLRSYSPLHNVRDGTCYPPTLIMTGDHDDRVVPSHSFKFAAALQRAQHCDKPILLRVETSAGHGFGKPTDKVIAEATDRLTFLTSVLGR
jgi:prolyl oligopeptidase